MKDHLIKSLREKGETLKVCKELGGRLIYISWIEDFHTNFNVGFFDTDIGLYPFFEQFTSYPLAFDYFLEKTKHYEY